MEEVGDVDSMGEELDKVDPLSLELEEVDSSVGVEDKLLGKELSETFKPVPWISIIVYSICEAKFYKGSEDDPEETPS